MRRLNIVNARRCLDLLHVEAVSARQDPSSSTVTCLESAVHAVGMSSTTVKFNEDTQLRPATRPGDAHGNAAPRGRSTLMGFLPYAARYSATGSLVAQTKLRFQEPTAPAAVQGRSDPLAASTLALQNYGGGRRTGTLLLSTLPPQAPPEEDPEKKKKDKQQQRFRRRLPPMREPSYSMASVKPANHDLEGSVVTQLTGLAAWLPQLPEMLLLCNEAVKRCVIDRLMPACPVDVFPLWWRAEPSGPLTLLLSTAMDAVARVVGRSSTRSPHSHLC